VGCGSALLMLPGEIEKAIMLTAKAGSGLPAPPLSVPVSAPGHAQ
jgi:hypothetical protein